MKHLEELGIDTSDASMIYIKCPMAGEITDCQCNIGQYEEGDCYAYTLSDLLEKLPKTIDFYHGKRTRRNAPIRMILSIDGYEEVLLGGDYHGHIIRYVSAYNGKGCEGYYHGSSLLECAYQELCWVKENGYL